MTIATERTSHHTVSLLEGGIVEESDLGSIRRVAADNFPILQGMSIKRLVINPGVMRTRIGMPTPTS
jgi:oxalate decarboxylase